jgi:hypothetical protein
LAPQFDRWGRYLIVPEGGDEPVPHTRATTHAATLDDRYGLEKWSQRMVAIGLSRRSDLLAQVAAAPEHDRGRIDSIVVDAIEAAEASKGRNIGEALHQFTERLDSGELELGNVPNPWQADVAAYRKSMGEAGFAVELIERTCVVPRLVVAGTFDRLVVRDGRRFVLDVKTGQRLDYGWGAIATQLAIYSRAATLYDFDTAEHSPMPEVDQRVGIVAHVPAGGGKCELVTVDLEVGWQGAELARLVRTWRKATFRLGDVGASLPSRREWLVAQVRRLVNEYPEAARDLAQRWPVGVPTLKADGHTDEQLGEIAAVLQQVEGEHRIPFADEPDPAQTTSGERRRAS